jgi:L-alanine-DL-glutamate epimerase-like enolase superfamily enzyme
MVSKIVGLEVFILRAPDTGRQHWVSHFAVPRANELLVRIRTSQGVEGFGLATSYGSFEPIVRAFRNGIGELVLGMDPLAPERLHEQLFALTSQRVAHEKGWGREALIRIAAAVDIACWDIIGKVAGLPPACRRGARYRIEGPGRYRTMTLATDEFIRRFLIHVLPKGFHRIRHYAFWARRSRGGFILVGGILVALTFLGG